MAEHAEPVQRPTATTTIAGWSAVRGGERPATAESLEPQHPQHPQHPHQQRQLGFDFAAIPLHAKPSARGCEVELDAGQAALVGAALAGPGLPLELSARRELGQMLGDDLGGVRVHTSRQAQHSATGLDARAYSVGQHIVFADGQYAPSTLEGRRLLTHELLHIQDGRIAPPRIRRQPTGAPVVAPPAGDQRIIVDESITFLRGAADFYSLRTGPPLRGRPEPEAGGVRVRLERLETQLASYLRIRDTAASLIDTALNSDAALTERLRVAYRAAVTALLDAASQEARRRSGDPATGDSPYELFQRHQRVIHEWAWPRGTTDPRAKVLLDRVPEAERTQIRRGDTIYNLPPATIDGYFHPRATAVRPPANTTVTVAPGLPDRIRAGLGRVAAMLTTTAQPPLPVNTTTTILLDLGRYGGGDRALYRFTHVQHAAPAGREVLVERLGSIAPDQRPPSERLVPAEVFARNGFIEAAAVPGQSISWPADQFALIQAAVAQVPESILGTLRGLKFVRVSGRNPTDPTKPASYDIDEHAMLLYDNAFGNIAPTLATPGGRASSDFDRLIAHELGHAVDFAPQRQALRTFRTSVAAQSGFHPTPAPGRPGRVILPPRERAAWRALQARIAREEAALTATRSLSGQRYERNAAGTLAQTEQLPAGEANDFRTAVAADGPTAVTSYAGTNLVEHFAEAFALYISEPQTLARLRPNVYAYFARRFPDPGRPPP